MVDHTTLEPPLTQHTRRFFRRRITGWIGVDVGTCAIKVAQVEHDRAGWRLITSRIIPIQDGQEVNDPAIIVFMGVIVAFVVLAIMLPLLDVSTMSH